ncbi:hypothetical protein LBMAG52_08680 [Planctomycetia bacterium]|nr:hypothetical protein LBMAG52_08680 [Planctomycetia bacterium]
MQKPGVRLASLVLLGCVVAAICATDCVAVEVGRVARVADAAKSPVIDGRIDDDCWKQATAHSDFVRFGGTAEHGSGAGTRKDTSFRLLHDDSWLYIAMDCQNERLRAIEPTVRGHDRGAAKDESVELFLGDREAAPPYYAHFIVSFANARDDRLVTGTNLNVKEYWDAPWRSATQRREDGWSVEIALPLQVVRSVSKFSRVAINVARNRRVPVIDSQNVVIEESRESSSWAPVAKSFHEPDRFRALSGLSDEMAVKAVPLVMLKSARVVPFDGAGAEGTFPVAVEVQLSGFNKQPAQVEVCLAEVGQSVDCDSITTKTPQPDGARPNRHRQVVDINDTTPRDVRLTLSLPDFERRELVVRLKAPASGMLLDERLVEGLDSLRPLTAFFGRNYYTSEKEAVLHCRLGMPPSARAGLLVDVRVAGARPNADANAAEFSRIPLRESGEITLPIADLKPGRHDVEITLRRESMPSQVLFKTSLPLVKREPNPGLEWKVDQARRVLMNNGQPFVPFGMVMSGVRDDDEAAFRKLAEHRFNTFMVWAKTTPEKLANYQSLAAKHRLVVISHPEECAEPIQWEAHSRYSGDLLNQVRRVTDAQNFIGLKNVIGLPIPVSARNAIFREFYDKNIDRVLAGVDAVKTAPNLAGYFIMDEPLPASLFDQYKFGQDLYARLHRADGYHPAIVNYSSFIPDGDQYTNWCDVLATDPYWYPPATDETRTTPNHVAKVCWQTNRRAEERRQPVWQILAGPRWSRCFKRPLNRDEIRCQTYLALIYRATGIFFFAYPQARDADWQTFRQLGDELQMLSPFVIGPDSNVPIHHRRAVLQQPTDTPEFKDSPFNPQAEQYPDVHAAVLRDDAGRLMLLATNSRHYPVACRFEIPGLSAMKVGWDSTLTETQQADPSRWNRNLRGAFEDRLAPYATRAWLIESHQLAAARPATITLHQTVLQADILKTEPNLPGGWRPGRKNAMPNPSFEDVSAEGCPDYCLVSNGTTPVDVGARFGPRCVQITKKPGSGFESLHLRCDPQDAQPQTYTFSVYMKADRAGLPVWLRGMQMNRHKEHGEAADLTLTTDWQRYWITGVIPAKVSESIYEVRLREPGTIWIDGVQLERGSIATEFEE